MGICWQHLLKGRKEAASSEPRPCVTVAMPRCEWRLLELCAAQAVLRDTLPIPP